MDPVRRFPLARPALCGLVAASLALGACTRTSDPVRDQFYREAGAVTDTGHFGTATMNNMGYMTGAQKWSHDLSQTFAREVNTTVNFAFNSAQLDTAAHETLRVQAAFIKQFPEVRFRVYGHTDAVGSAAYNKSLGLRRANAVVQFLTAQGISRNRLEAVVSFGEQQPLIVTQGRERRNRRTVTEVSGFVESHPTVLDGRYAEIVYREYVRSATVPSTLTQSQSSGLTLSAGGGN